MMEETSPSDDPHYPSVMSDSFDRLISTPILAPCRAIVGGVQALLSAATLAQFPALNRSANQFLGSGLLGIQDLYTGLLGTIFPWAEVRMGEQSRCGLLAASFGRRASIWLDRKVGPGSTWVERHLIARIGNLWRVGAMLPIRTIDMAIGLCAMVVSFATVGLFPKVNTVAARGLSGTRLLSDLYSVIKVAAPQAEGFPPY